MVSLECCQREQRKLANVGAELLRVSFHWLYFLCDETRVSALSGIENGLSSTWE